jgi:thiol-disulfide isomerase/thioredoxin
VLTVTGNGSALFAVIFAAHVYRAKLDDARANSHDRYTSRDDGMMDSLSEDILGTLDENELEEAGGFSVDLGDSRACRHQMEIVMRDAIQRDVAVMTGAEAHGWGEMAYGAGRGEDGLVAMITLGIGFGVALFDGGVLVRASSHSEHRACVFSFVSTSVLPIVPMFVFARGVNRERMSPTVHLMREVQVRHMDLNALKSWNGNQWIGAPLPEEGSTDAGAWQVDARRAPTERNLTQVKSYRRPQNRTQFHPRSCLSQVLSAFCPDDGACVRTQRWAERVEQYICELETVCNPEVIIIGGAALRSFNDWVPRMKKVRAAVKCGQLGKLAGVKGSAYGASFQLKMRDDLRKVRAAVGNSLGASPQKITDSQLQELFNSFDASKNDSISPTELVSLLSAVGVKLPENEMRELVFEMDEDNSGSISFHEFSEWWKEEFATPLVELMHTEAELDQVFAEEMASNRLVVLEVGFTFCRPCRAFEEKYKAFAREFKDARFLRCNGNENADMIHLGRDRLQIKSTPTFFLFRKGEQIDMWGGASEERFRQKLMRALLAEEQGYDAEYVYSEEEPSK